MIRLPDAPDRYDPRDQDELRHALHQAMAGLESRVTTPLISGDRGDSSVTLNAGTDFPVQRWATTLTANRTVTLGLGGPGAQFTILRTGLGAFTLDVGPGLQVIPASTAATVDVGVGAGGWTLLRYAPLTTAAAAATGVKAYKAADQTISTGTNTALNFDTEAFDTNSYHDNATNNTRFTVPTGLAGKYIITARCLFAANATGKRDIFIRLNGTTTICEVQNSNPGSSACGQCLCLTYNLAVGDYIELVCFQDSGGNLVAAAGAGADTGMEMLYLGT